MFVLDEENSKSIIFNQLSFFHHKSIMTTILFGNLEIKLWVSRVTFEKSSDYQYVSLSPTGRVPITEKDQ